MEGLFYNFLDSNYKLTNATGAPLLKPRPEPFDYERSTKDLYWYYMFHLTKKGK
jgi:hypothetical protein